MVCSYSYDNLSTVKTIDRKALISATITFCCESTTDVTTSCYPDRCGNIPVLTNLDACENIWRNSMARI